LSGSMSLKTCPTSKASITAPAFTRRSTIKALSTTNPPSANQTNITLNARPFYKGAHYAGIKISCHQKPGGGFKISRTA
jgi:hypothetical protein